MLTYFLISIAVVNVLAVVVIARLGRRLSGTADELRHPVVRRGADPITFVASYAHPTSSAKVVPVLAPVAHGCDGPPDRPRDRVLGTYRRSLLLSDSM